MRVSLFVLDVDEARDRAFRWAREGRISRVSLQTDSWPHAAKNRADFPRWKAELSPFGVPVYATMWCGDDPDAMPERIAETRGAVAPQGWTFNVESPPKLWEGQDLRPSMRAFAPEPVCVSYNIPAERIGLDFRAIDAAGAEIHGQAYDPDGDSTKGPTPAVHVESAFYPVVCWFAGGGRAWHYRVKASGRWAWRQAVAFDGSRITMRAPDGSLVYADGVVVDGALRFTEARTVRSSLGDVIGSVYGIAAYHRIGYSLGTTRPIAPQQLADLALNARAHGLARVKKCSIYCGENTSEEQIAALNALA